MGRTGTNHVFLSFFAVRMLCISIFIPKFLCLVNTYYRVQLHLTRHTMRTPTAVFFFLSFRRSVCLHTYLGTKNKHWKRTQGNVFRDSKKQCSRGTRREMGNDFGIWIVGKHIK